MPGYYCNFDLKDAKGKVLYQYRAQSCFGVLFNSYEREDFSKCETMHYHVYATDPKNCDWFYENFIKDRLIDRVKNHVKLVDYEIEHDGRILPAQRWKTVIFDISKLTAVDLFVLCNLFRYPQENNDFVPRMKHFAELKGEKPFTIEECWIKAHAFLNDGNYGHALQTYEIQYAFNKRFPKYSFVKRWLKFEPGSVGMSMPFNMDKRKPNSVSSVFTAIRED